ncbi:hypothetical protein VTK26DRAFT_7463 [Humicola hyalothermophila]
MSQSNLEQLQSATLDNLQPTKQEQSLQNLRLAAGWVASANFLPCVCLTTRNDGFLSHPDHIANPPSFGDSPPRRVAAEILAFQSSLLLARQFGPRPSATFPPTRRGAVDPLEPLPPFPDPPVPFPQVPGPKLTSFLCTAQAEIDFVSQLGS